jgi:hypothetical protein
MSTNPLRWSPLAILATGLCFALAACTQRNETGGISPEKMADALHAVMAADRTVYTSAVVNRLQNEEQIINASEYWQDEKTLPLPAQMFRMGAEMVRDGGANFSYALLSLWPVNRQNGPKTEAETDGLQYVVDNPDENYYTEEVLGGRRYFTAVYADKAVSQACVTCHNTHKDSPRRDFNLNDVMGGVVIRIPLN